MAIGTYAELKTAVANYLHRSDLTTVIPDFVRLCEANVRRDLRVRAMEATATGTLVANELATPTGFLEARRVVLGTTKQEYATPTDFYDVRSQVTGHYTIVGTNFVFQPGSADYSIDYFKAFTAFSGDSDTNWLLTNHPDVYLFGSLAEAALYTQDDPAMWMSKYRFAVDRVRTEERNAFGPLVIRPDSRNTP